MRIELDCSDLANLRTWQTVNVLCSAAKRWLAVCTDLFHFGNG